MKLDPQKIKKIWDAVKRIIEVIIGFLAGTGLENLF